METEFHFGKMTLASPAPMGSPWTHWQLPLWCLGGSSAGGQGSPDIWGLNSPGLSISCGGMGQGGEVVCKIISWWDNPETHFPWEPNH